MPKRLVIVESPAKARTLKRYLGDDYTVKASMGHVKDLPKSSLGVDVEQGFKPDYQVIKGKAKALRELKKAAKGVDEVFLAPDPDREGEAIAWHVYQELQDGGPDVIHRVMFNEITPRAVREAFDNPGTIDIDKVHAQQARRILDRLVGYKISPLLWQKVRRGLSAGRVQSVAQRLICDREREIKAFVSEEYWTIEAILEGAQPPSFTAKLNRIDQEKPALGTEADAQAVLEALEGADFVVAEVKRKERRRNPVAPFITASLQAEAARRLHWSAKQTMATAQRLYEGLELGPEGPVGLITYMRTDSPRVSAEAQAVARDYIGRTFGQDYLPDRSPTYKARRRAQEAHEAIRPTDVEQTPDRLRNLIGEREWRLYQLIWQRFVSSQMAPAILDQTTVDITARQFSFRATGSIVKFPGFTKIYTEVKDNDKEETDKVLPPLEAGERLTLGELTPNQHFTQPPPRYTEASLVRALEEKGIGRPSTYASILSIIRDREYVEVEERRFRPTELGLMITDLLVKSFPDLLGVEFTANMEETLDEIEEGKKDWVETLEAFYGPFTERLEKAEVQMKNLKEEVEPTDEVCEECGSPMVKRWGKYGRFLACSAYPECRNTRDLDTQPSEHPEIQLAPDESPCPECGSPLAVRKGRFGPFIACSSYPKCRYVKPNITGVTCPEEGCGGEVAERRSRQGKLFYGCTSYPECRFTLRNRPVPEACPLCDAPYLLVRVNRAGEASARCPTKGCGHTQPHSAVA
ncbi:type I DNA topoisomerase [Nitrospinae bacterium AH-259-F20]|nr:type I DNA topoisomerase [Nitrospinae bacterium AH-259-F20]